MSVTELWVGIDWATEEHEVCVVSGDGKKVTGFKVAHDGEALHKFADQLLLMADGDVSRINVAIETPRGSVVATLLERGFAVYAINPKQLDHFRGRHSNAGNKSDRLDAHVAADSLRTDKKSFTQVKLEPGALLQLREATRMHDELTQEKQRLLNQMREQLLRYFPQFLLLGDLDGIWVWRLLKEIPTPTDARKNTAASKARKTLKEQRVRRLNADQVMEFLRRTPVPVAPGVTEAGCMHVQSLLPRLEMAHSLLVACDRNIKRLLGEQEDVVLDGQKREQRDVELILSLPGAGNYIAGTMLSEAWQPLRELNYHAYRSRGGVAPVTKQTGKQRSNQKRGGPKPLIHMRHACNERLRQALHHLAAGATQQDSYAQRLYQEARARGKTHGHALRIVADRLLQVLFVMLKTGKAYEPERWGRHSPAPTTTNRPGLKNAA